MLFLSRGVLLSSRKACRISVLLVPVLSLKQGERIRYSTALGVHPEVSDPEQVEQLKNRSADRQKAVKPGTAQLGGEAANEMSFSDRDLSQTRSISELLLACGSGPTEALSKLKASRKPII
jgi:hypothetical protein